MVIFFSNKDLASSMVNMNILVGSFSIEFKEDEIVHQLQEVMEIDEHDSFPLNHAWDDLMSKYAHSSTSFNYVL